MFCCEAPEMSNYRLRNVARLSASKNTSLCKRASCKQNPNKHSINPPSEARLSFVLFSIHTCALGAAPVHPQPSAGAAGCSHSVTQSLFPSAADQRGFEQSDHKPQTWVKYTHKNMIPWPKKKKWHIIQLRWGSHNGLINHFCSVCS